MRATGASTRIGPAGAAALMLVAVLAFLWPALLTGSPSYISDSSSYYRAGRAAVQAASGRFAHDAEVRPSGATADADRSPPNADSAGEGQRPGVRGLRSLTYSIAAYLLSWGTELWPLIVLQSVMVTLLLAVYARVALPRAAAATVLGVLAILAFGSPVATFVVLASPDIFAGVLIAAVLLLVCFDRVLRPVERVGLTLAVTAAVTAHASHIALGGVVLVMAAVLTTASMASGRFRHRVGRWRMPVIGVVLGLAINMAAGLLAFGEASVAAKHYPFALARSVEDGPAFWYLQDDCRRHQWAICELYPGGAMPRSNLEFLWGENGLARRASPAQMDRIRAEEGAIVRAAVWRYPWYQLAATGSNIARQFAAVGIDPARYQGTRLDAQGQFVDRTGSTPGSFRWLVPVQIVVALLSIGALAVRLRRAPSQWQGAVALALFLIAANSVICGGVSAPDVRYQNRVIWILPLLAMTLFLRPRQSASDDRR